MCLQIVIIASNDFVYDSSRSIHRGFLVCIYCSCLCVSLDTSHLHIASIQHQQDLVCFTTESLTKDVERSTGLCHGCAFRSLRGAILTEPELADMLKMGIWSPLLGFQLTYISCLTFQLVCYVKMLCH